jgi:hypothetical protein
MMKELKIYIAPIVYGAVALGIGYIIGKTTYVDVNINIGYNRKITSKTRVSYLNK